MSAEPNIGEAVPLTEVETCQIEVEQAERLYSQLRREAAALPDAMREAAKAQDVEALARLHDRARDIKGELFLAGAALTRRRLSLLEADSKQTTGRLREVLEERAEVADLWRQATEVVASFEEEHNRVSLEMAMLDNKLTVNRQQMRDLKAELNELIEEQVKLGEVV